MKTDETAPRSGVHEVVREFIATREKFTGPEVAAALREAGHVGLAARILDDPELVTALVNEHAGPGGDDEQDEGARHDRRRLRAGASPSQRQARACLPRPGESRPEIFRGDVIIDEHGDEWELVGRPTTVVGAQDFVTTARRVDRPADMREERWRAHARVRCGKLSGR